MKVFIPRFAALTLAAGLVFAACSSGTPATLAPVPTPSPTETPAPTDTPAPTETPTLEPTATPIATPTPAAPTPIPVQTPGLAGDPTTCTDWAKYSSYFTSAVHSLPSGYYCASLPSGWILNSFAWAKPKTGGWMTINYHNKAKTQTITIGQGDFCAQTADPSNCWTSASDLGTATFGNLSGTLEQLSGGQFAVFVNPNTKTGYQIVGKGMTQSAFVVMAAAMVLIPKA
jgi:hypothetical protein